jgi:hypothetical protein
MMVKFKLNARHNYSDECLFIKLLVNLNHFYVTKQALF